MAFWGVCTLVSPKLPNQWDAVGFTKVPPARPRPAAPSESVSGPWPWDAPASTGLGVLPSPASMSPRAAVSLWVLTRAFSLSEAHQGKRSPPRPVRWPALGVQLRPRRAGQPASGHPRALPRHVALQVTGVDLFCTFSFCPLTIWENNLSTTSRVAKAAKQSLSLYSLLSLDLHG